MTDFIQETVDKLQSQKALMLEEVKRIDAAITALTGVSVPTQSKPAIKPISRPDYGKHTKKEMILGVLRDHPNGLAFAKISPLIMEKYHIEIRKQNISPALTKLRKAGDIDQANDRWYAKEHIPKPVGQATFQALEPQVRRNPEPVFYGGGKTT